MAARRILLMLLAFAPAGCGTASDKPELVWGKRGVVAGDFVRPRAIAIGPGDRVYVVDFTARIQAFDADGRYLNAGWTTPDWRNGRPSGLSIANDGNLIVSDSHYHTVRIYTPTGTEVRTLGGTAGTEPGQFGYVSDCVQDTDGGFFVSEFGLNERITKLAPDGTCLKVWGRQGTGPGEFNHIRALALSPDGLLYVADACNHRVQVFTREGECVKEIGTHGRGLGEFAYPYDVAFNAAGDWYVAEYDNHRVQKFSRDGKPLATWGGPGRGPGKLHNPWALAVDSRGRLLIVDTENHRVQRVRF